MNLNTPSNSTSKQVKFSVTAIIAVLIALSFRSTQAVGVDLFHPGLWAEDGSIFINEAHGAGLGYLFKPYAGYMHLIPRAVSYLISFISLEHAPLAFHLAWLLAFISTVYVIQSRLVSIGALPVFCIWALVLLTIQPQAGEVFFTITNIQWFTGLALITYLIFPLVHPPRIWEIALISIASLTGPFSVLALPVLVLRAAIYRDLRKNRAVYLAVAVCAGIQIAFILLSPRPIAAHSTDIEIGVLIAALVKTLSFGSEYPLASLFAFVFWASLPWHRILRALVERIRNGHTANTPAPPELCALMLMITALGMMLVGFLRDDPSTMSPVILSNGAAGGSRYYLIPYSLLILAAVVSTIREYPRTIVALMAMSIICVSNFVRPERINHQWHAYTKLAQAVPGLVIPIAPKIEADPGWSVDAAGTYSGSATPPRGILVPLDSMDVTNGDVTSVDGKAIIRSKSDSLLLTFSTATCASRTIGIEIDGQRDFAGWVHVLWTKKDAFNDKDSTLRFYPAGTFRGLLAFDRDVSQDQVRIRPGFVAGNTEIRQVLLYCL